MPFNTSKACSKPEGKLKNGQCKEFTLNINLNLNFQWEGNVVLDLQYFKNGFCNIQRCNERHYY